ncbi:MAG: outer membrane protein assembly factor BamB family protein [Planctomycetaceae bacterium]
MKRILTVITLLAGSTITSAADRPLEWPRFRGSGGSGVADASRPPVELGPETNLRWKVAVPRGLSSPIVVGDRLIVTAFENGALFTIAYNRADGSEAWRARAPAGEIEPFNKKEGSPAASTCATDGERVVAYFGSCGLFCYDQNGHELWRFEMPAARTMGDLGSGASPILEQGLVILLRDEMHASKIIALDAVAGKPRWQQKRQSLAGYSTPAIWSTPAGPCVAAPGFRRMIGYDLLTGAEKWHVAGMPAIACASPCPSGGDLFFAAWSPGDPADQSGFQTPTYDQLLKQGDTDGDGVLSRAEAQNTPLKDFFDGNDRNKDGNLTREEWNVLLEYSAESKNSAFALSPGGTGDLTDTHVRFRKTKGLPYVPSALVYRGQFVMVKDGGIVTAYDAQSGAEVYQKRALPNAAYYASPIAANGNIYFASVDDGSITVMKAGQTTPEIVARNAPLNERIIATPAIAGDTLYVRTAEQLYAFEGK